MGEAARQRPAHRLVITQQVARCENQVIEVEKGSRALVVAEAVEHRLHQTHEVGQNTRSDHLLHRFPRPAAGGVVRSEEHTSELQSLMRISYAVFCLKNK